MVADAANSARAEGVLSTSSSPSNRKIVAPDCSVKIVAGCDVDANRTADFRKRFPEARIYSDYRELLEEKLAEARENRKFSHVKIPPLVEMVQAQVPQDALAKVQRRFRMLDRGPARVRQQPATRGKRVPKS